MTFTPATFALFALLSVYSAPADAVPEESGLFRALGWVAYGASAADLLSTHAALRQPGVYEGNPLQRNTAVRVGSHVALPVLMNWTTGELHRNGYRKTALWMRIGFLAGYGYVVANNLRHAR